MQVHLPCAALPSLSESSLAAEFLRVRECMMDRRTLEMKRQWSTFDGEVLLQNLYIIVSVRPWTLRMWALRMFGAAAQSTHVARMTHWGSGSSDSGLPDNTAVKGCCATSGRNPSRCGEAKRRTQLVSKTKDEQRPSGQASAAWRAWVRMHTSKKCFAESDTTFEAAQSCRAARGHTSAYRDAERLGRPATESGEHGTTLPSKLTGPGWLWQG